MQQTLNWQRLLPASVLFACIPIVIVRTWHWPAISDATLIQYIVLLMHHGWVPYRDIVDVNLPGSFLIGEVVHRVFGDRALGWRLFDLTLSALAIFAMIWIAKPYRTAGAYAGVLFVLMHAADGPAETGQRDLILAIFLLAGYASLFWGLRQERWLGVGLCGLSIGYAATIKPQAAILGLALLGVAAIVLHKRKKPAGLYLFCGITGLLLPPVAFAGLLEWKQALRPFYDIVGGLDIYHTGLARHSNAFLMTHAIPTVLLPLTLLALWIAAANKSWKHWETASILLGMCFGFLSFCLQGKGYPYHRYPLLVFLLLFIAIQLATQLRTAGFARKAAAAGFLYAALWIAPASTVKSLRYDWHDQSSLMSLQSDLVRIGVPQLSGNIQCMDTISGCIAALDHLRVTESSGFLYDCYFFASGVNPVQTEMREEFWQQLQKKPPRVFVVVDRWCFNQPAGYQKLATWPQFDNFLAEKYTLSEVHVAEPGGNRHLATWPFGYRIYLQK